MQIRLLTAAVAALLVAQGCNQNPPAHGQTPTAPQSRAPDRSAASAEKEPAASPVRISTAFEQAARRVLPSVVTLRRVALPSVPPPTQDPRKPPPPDELMRRLLGAFEEPQETVSSGLVIDASGLILTSEHAVRGRAELTVVLRDGSEFKPTEIKADPRSDLALVRIKDAGPLSAAVLGDSDQMEIGDWVLAIGSPFGLEASVTAGILSAKSRSLDTARQQDFMQTDAAINPGNSGGPLVNLRGEVIGISAAIESTSGMYEGVGFAIPINRAKWISQQLAKQGTVRRAYLGVGVQELTPALSRKLEAPAGRGLVVAEVRPNSPAALAGVRLGDVITQFAGHPVPSWAVFTTAIERMAIDSQQRIGLVREGKPLELPVTIREEPREEARD